MARIVKFFQAHSLSDLLSRDLPPDCRAEIVQPGVGPVWSGRRVNGQWLRDPRLDWEIPVALLSEGANGFSLEQGAGGFSLPGDGTWQLVADNANPIVEVRFPAIGVGERAQRCAVTLESMLFGSPAFTAGQFELDTGIMLIAEGESGGADEYSACAQVWVGSAVYRYNLTKTAAATYASEFMGSGTHLWMAHEVSDDASVAKAISKTRAADSADIANATMKSARTNPGIVPGTDGWEWVLQVRQGASGATNTVIVSHVEFGGGGGGVPT